MKHGYNHVEAFCLMTYRERNGEKEVRVWNSRDGVTPFVIPIDDHEYMHENWNDDKRDPEYIPEVGSYIFMDYTLSSLAAVYTEWARRHWSNQQFRLQFSYGRETTPEEVGMERARDELKEAGEPPPRLVQVSEEILLGITLERRRAATLSDAIRRQRRSLQGVGLRHG